MKLISAIIKHQRLDEVRKALILLGIHGMTITDVKGFGRQKGHTEVYRGAEYEVKFLPKIRMDVAVPDKLLESAVSAIKEAARTGAIGDGKIFIIGLENVLRIRTDEQGEEAL